MILSVLTAELDKVEASTDKDDTGEVEEEVDDTEEDIVTTEVVEELAAHMKIVLESQISPDTLKMKSGPHS